MIHDIHTHHHHHLAKLTPIRLRDEGYSQVVVAVGGDYFVEASGFIDEECEWIVRISLMPEIETLDEPSIAPMTVYLIHENGDREVLANSILHILPTVKPVDYDAQ